VDIFFELINAFDWQTVIRTCARLFLILVVAWISLVILRNVLHRVEKRWLKKSEVAGEPPSESAKRVDTLVRLIRQGVHLTLWIIVGLTILKELGVEIGPILAGAGILGLAVGFGAQNLVRDIISGFFFILENQIRVGDVAIINGTGGIVEEINFRTIVLRDLSGVVHVFPNGTVTTLSNMTNEWSAYVFEIGVAYKESTDRVTEVMREVFVGMQEDETYGPLILEDPEIMGVDKFADSAVIIKGRIKTRPIRQWMVGREFNRRIKYAFDEKGIEIPFPHRSIYFGEASKPFAAEAMEHLEKKSREKKK
jgi:small conductance mechanosensitive channel